MQIKTRLNAVSWVAVIIAILVILIFLLTREKLIRSIARHDLAEQMLSTAYKRSVVRAEYFLSRDDRPKEQWLQLTDSLSKLIKQAQAISAFPEQRLILQQIWALQDKTRSLFSQLSENRREMANGSITDVIGQEIERRVFGQLIIDSQTLITQLLRLQKLADQEYLASQTRINLLMLIFVMLLSGFTVFSLIIVARSIAVPLRRLKEGIAVIATGNLDHRVAVVGNDELSDLARDSNEMAAKLSDSYTSVENLQKEIEERRKAEEALAESLERFQMANRATFDVIWDWNLQTDALWWNPNLQEVFGYQADEIEPGIESWSNRIHSEDHERVKTGIQAALASGAEFWSDHYRFSRKDGSFAEIDDRGHISRDSKGKSVRMIGAMHDVTQRRQMESRLEATVEELHRSNKELEQFAYVASHDLQEPLRMVSSYTQLLAQRYENQLDDKARLFIHYAVDGAVRMQLLINDLLIYSRIGTKGNPLESVNLHAVLGEVINNLNVSIDEAKAIITNGDLPEVRADASQLVQLFQNLIGNAVKFRGEAYPHIHITAKEEGSHWLFSVEDNGIGIDPQFSDKIFVIFQRLHTKEEYPGSGMGLAICKKIVERHGGRIWFESEPGKGATFYFTILK